MFTSRHITLIALLLQAVPAAAASDAADEMTKADMRHRLAACGAEWQKMKRSGAEGTLIWREFSKSCLARTKRPTTPRNENASPIR